jgi:hypothetical protein
MKTKKKFKLNKKFKQKWLNALRSDKYKQGVNALHNTTNNTYCCLGVACKVAHISNNIIDNDFTINSRMVKLPIKQSYDASAIKQLMDNYNIQRLLMDKNDVLQHTFKQIANFIEKNY